jgi:hypothetical protein
VYTCIILPTLLQPFPGAFLLESVCQRFEPLPDGDEEVAEVCVQREGLCRETRGHRIRQAALLGCSQHFILALLRQFFLDIDIY